MAIIVKRRQTIREVTPEGIYDVEMVEVSRKRIYPEDEVRQIFAEAIKRTKERLERMDVVSLKLDPYYEIARDAMDMVKERFDLSIKPKVKSLSPQPKEKEEVGG